MCRATSTLSDNSGLSAKKKMSSSTPRKERRPSGGGGSARPAFEGAKFDRDGMCLKHPSVSLAEPVKQDGRLVWKETRLTCPKCASEHHKSRRVTSLGGAGKVKRGRSVHGTANPLAKPAASGRHRDKQFDTPFDDKGRCHHHPDMQMASKKVRGGWKILHTACSKCIEANYDEESVASGRSGRSRGRDRDDGSVDSRGSRRRQVKSRTRPVVEGGRFDKNGCCTAHPTVQIAKKKLIGGWKEYRTCPKCLDPNYDDMADNASVASGRSGKSFRSHGTAKSGRSRKSTRSTKSGAGGGRKGGRKTDRYGALPFDGDGFCHAHPGVRLAKKKALGGWKVLHDICPDCAHDASSQAGGSRSSRGTGRYFGDDGSDVSSYRSGKSAGKERKKKIRVKGMRYQDEHGREGRYSGDVNEDHAPHGQGKIKYKDGSGFEGVWSEGSQVHGKNIKAKKVPAAEAGDAKTVRRSGGGRSGDNGAKTVRKMKWMDYYGDPGEYTGEIDAKTKMPHGRGAMRYDHGLVQEGRWMGGKFVEGSDAAEGADGGGGDAAEWGRDDRRGREGGGGRPAGHRKPSEGRASHGDRQKKPASTRAPPEGRGLEP